MDNILGFVELDADILLKSARKYKKYILKLNYNYVKEGAEYITGKPKKTGLIYYILGFFKKRECWTYKEAFQFVNRKEDDFYAGSSLIRKRYWRSLEIADLLIEACKAAKNNKIIINLEEMNHFITFYRKEINAR